MTDNTTRKLQIAICRRRNDRTYKNTRVTWADLAERLKDTVRTNETLAEYKAMSKSRQSDIKDVGGFVGGYLINGRRSKTTVGGRDLITLDMDNCGPEAVEDIDMMDGIGYEMVIYSTHKHTPEAPRLRLILPLTRQVTPDEYEFLARTVAHSIDKSMMLLDDTTYQPSRMMFWPSTSKDGEYLYRHYPDKWLDPDTELAKYPNWKDMSTWPYSLRETQEVQTHISKAQDPTSKDGLIGAFCRTYTVQDAILKFLPDVYIPTDRADRWTYAEGSTAGGLVIYDDVQAYSNHATDPAGDGHSHNAFDLVRIHKFGGLDAGAKKQTTAGNMPSFKEMSRLVQNDEECKKQMGRETFAQAMDDFGEDFDEEETDDNWLRDLEYNKKGELVMSSPNVQIILEHDPKLKDNIGGYDEFNAKSVKFGPMPWDTDFDPRNPGWTDFDDANLRIDLERRYHLSGPNKINDALDAVHMRHAFHPVRDYLDPLQWDGIERLDTLLIDYLGAEDTPYTRAVTRKAFTAAVKRIYVPGCKMDYMLTMAGPQGVGKSYLLNMMGGKWFTDSIYTMQGKEAYEALHGSWIVEVAELAAARKSDIEQMKQFISKQSDRYRKAYGHNVVDYPRQCVFFGTTNDMEFLRDYTGNRRFWPVGVGINKPTRSIFTDLPDERDQIWAEAKVRYQQNEPLFLADDLAKAAMDMQERYTFKSAKEQDIANYLDVKLPENWYEMNAGDRCIWLQNEDTKNTGTVSRDRVSGIEIWVEVFNGNRRNFTNADQREISAIMQHLGWARSANPLFIDHTEYYRQRAYLRPKKSDNGRIKKAGSDNA